MEVDQEVAHNPAEPKVDREVVRTGVDFLGVD